MLRTSLLLLLLTQPAIALALGGDAAQRTTMRRPGRVMRVERTGSNGQRERIWVAHRDGRSSAQVLSVDADKLAFARRLAYPAARDGKPTSYLADVRLGVKASANINRRMKIASARHGETPSHQTWLDIIRVRDHSLPGIGHQRYFHEQNFGRYVTAAQEFISGHPEYANRDLPAPADLRAELTARGQDPAADPAFTKLEHAWSELERTAHGLQRIERQEALLRVLAR